MKRSPRPGDEPIPGYRLKHILGRSQTAVVWRATAPDGGFAALKFINVRERSGLKELRGAMRVRNVRHPNLLPIIGCWVLDEEGLILDDEGLRQLGSVTDVPEEDMDGTMRVGPPPATTLIIGMPVGDKSLHDLLKERQNAGHRGIPAPELLRYTRQAAEGIDFLNSPRHDLGDGRVAIQHCDIKPQNILLVGGNAVVCDFGLARVSAGSNLATLGGSAGTPAYIAPECIHGVHPSHATDQYSLAITYFELRTGRLPFSDDTLESVYTAHQTGRLNLEALPAAERPVIQRATAINPDERYASATDLADALRQAAGESESEEPPAPAAYRGTMELPQPVEESGDSEESEVRAPGELETVDKSQPPVRAAADSAAAAPGNGLPERGNGESAHGARSIPQMQNILRQSLGHYTTLIETNESDALPYFCRGAVYWFFGEFDRAIDDCDQALRRAGDNAAIFASRAMARCAKGEFNGALADCDEAIRQDPQEPMYFLSRALIHIGLGEHQQAVVDCDAALQHDPECLAAFSLRAEAHLAEGDVDRAEADLRRAAELLQ